MKLWMVVALGIGTLAGAIAQPSVARAQSTTSGAIAGVVTGKRTGEKLAGVLVTVTSPALQGAQTTFTDDAGSYKISPLPPGDYMVSFYYLSVTHKRRGISVGVNRTAPVYQELDTERAAGEIVTIVDAAPAIDPTSTTQGISIDKDYLQRVPIPGRTFEAALGAAAGSQDDELGASFSGSTSLENQYYIDGVNTTGVTFGMVGSPIINDFIEEIEVLTGGYNAEFGRATGGIVNIVTKSGSNEFKGSVFSTFRPGALTAPAQRTPSDTSAIDATTDNAYEFDAGFEVGGPIVRDRLWFFVGFVPQFEKSDITRTTHRRTDCYKFGVAGCDARLPSAGGNADGKPDIDPETGFYRTELLDREIRSETLRTYNFLGKLNFAATPEHQGQLSLMVLPQSERADGVFGPIQNGSQSRLLVTDAAFKWTSKFNDNKTEIEAVIGWHRETFEVGGLDASLDDRPLQALQNGFLDVWGRGFASESARTIAGCEDGAAGDPYRSIANCPMDTEYVVGGPGEITDDLEERRAGRFSLTQRAKALGSHEFKAGVDVEHNLARHERAFSGGAFIENFVGPGEVVVTRWVQLLGLEDSPSVMDNTDPRFDDECGESVSDESGLYVCDYLGAAGVRVEGSTLNWSAYLRDSWQIRPNLTLNAGVRYEEQRMRYANHLQHQLDPITGAVLGKNAMVLTGNWSPRVGALYDWTHEGRSKMYAHWGRFYESIPMDINTRTFGGETIFEQTFEDAGSRCGAGTDAAIGGANGESCLDADSEDDTELFGAGVLIAPGIKSQYMDEIIAGIEYELIDDVKVGVAYQNRRIGRVIEDVSTDGADTYIIANPGEWSTAEEAKLEAAIEAAEDAGDEDAVERLENQLEMYRGIRAFDKPRRDYHALQFTAAGRFARRWFLQGSYTYSQVKGNYPGLFAPDVGQVDPNISSQYDLIELLGNRFGLLPYDRPHSIKLDGYYSFDLKKLGELTIGARARAQSGIPTNALAAHAKYGERESFLLPRGQLGRADFTHGLDLHIGYAKQLGKRVKLEIWADVYNAYNDQGSASVDDVYAPQFKLAAPNSASGSEQNANPVSGGTYEDLIFVKTIDSSGDETSEPIGKNPNFRKTRTRYAPAYVQFGARLSF